MRKFFKEIALIFALLFTIFLSSCDEDEGGGGYGYITWARTYGGNDEDAAYSIQQTTNGWYILTGSTRSFGSGSQELWVLILDEKGNKVLENIYGGIEWDRVNSILQSQDGGYVLAGNDSGDISILKLNMIGNLIWQKTCGGSSDDVAHTIQQTSDGGYIIAGMTRSFGSGGYDAWILKLDNEGNKIWDKTYGGVSDEVANSIQQTRDGGYIVAGEVPAFRLGYPDFWILKLDENGNKLWDKTYGGFQFDVAWIIKQTHDGGYIVVGYTHTYSFGAGYDVDAWILKLDNEGNKLWDKTYGGDDWDIVWSIQQIQDGGYIVAGETDSFGDVWNVDLWILKIDKNGEIIWDKTYGGSDADVAFSIQQTQDGGYAVVGYSESFGAGDKDFWVLKLDEDGNCNGPGCP